MFPDQQEKPILDLPKILEEIRSNALTNIKLSECLSINTKAQPELITLPNRQGFYGFHVLSSGEMIYSF